MNWSIKNVVFLIAIFSLSSVKSQNSEIDSLKIELHNNQSEGNKKSVSENLRALGVAYFEKGDYAKAAIYYEKALKISEETNNERMQSRCLMNIGNVYLVRDNYPMALEYYNKSLTISEKRKDTTLISLSLNNMGLLYNNLERYDKALALSERALKIQKKKGDKKRIAETLNALGIFHNHLNNHDQALTHLVEAYEIGKNIKNEYINGFSLNNIGYTYLKLEDYDNALIYYEKARRINEGIGGKRALSVSYFGLAKVNTLLEKYDSALNNALKSKRLLNELNMANIMREIEELLSIIYQKTGNYKKAFESHQQFKVLNDSLFNKKNIEKITQLEYEYKYKQALDSANIRELKLSKTVLTTSQDLAKSRQNSLWAVIGILLVSILLGGAYFFQKYQNVKVKNQTILTEQKLMRSQMTPHFMFNSLSVLQGMILNKEESKSISYLSKFSKLLRTTLENSRHKMVPLSEELSAINSYMELQNLDVDPPYNYTLTVDSEIDETIFDVPPMLIQPFVENAVEHAFISEKEDKEIEVQLSFKEKKLTCTITDNGMGINNDQPKIKKNKKSLATTITSERLRMLAKEFGVESSVSVQNRKLLGEQGTLVTLVIPYKINSVS